MKKYDLSVIIMARNEAYLARTVEEVLTKRRGNTEVIVILDGAWADPPLPDHEDVTIIFHSTSIGQRASLNEGARLSQAKFIMKLDAHCALDEGFDVKLMENCEYDWTVVPTLYNLHVFDWHCKKCGNKWYQGPTPTHCFKDYNAKIQNELCDSKEFEKVMMWQPRWSRKTYFMRFDKNLHFQYFGGFADRPEAKNDIAPTMSLLGACFFLHRQRYWDLGGSEESWGSWGNQGTEISCKAWLSGGKLVVNKKTWYSHLFRTQGGDFGFPYPQSGSQVDHARKSSQEMFFGNTFKKQIYPLYDLVKAFWPVPGWEQKDLDNLLPSALAFKSSKSFTYETDPLISSITSVSDGEVVSMSSSASIPSSEKHILGVSDKSQMAGVTTSSIQTGVINFQRFIESVGDKNLIGKSMRLNPLTIDPTIPFTFVIEELAVSRRGNITSPYPTIVSSIPELDVSDEPENSTIVNISHGNNIQQNKGIIYYTDNQLILKIAHRVQKQLKKIGLPIVSASLKPMDFGKNIHLNLKRGYLTMAKQILSALEASESEIIYFCEHDVLYHKSHFDFTPEKKDVYYYNVNVWKVRSSDGHAVKVDDCKQLSGLCGYRDTLIEHFTKRLKVFEANEPREDFNSFVRAVGFEPGTHGRPERIDDLKCDIWSSEYPNVDIRHDSNLTSSRWSPDQFRNQKFTEGWTEADNIPGWGVIKGRFWEFLAEI